MTGYSLKGPRRPTGKDRRGHIVLDGSTCARCRREGLRHMRGNRIAMIFQDPMMTLNPVLRIDVQMIEAILAHDEREPARGARARARRSSRSAFPRPTSASRRIRINSPAACASASRSPSPC
jgi:peptide/nickel transport system ATP-binding protein